MSRNLHDQRAAVKETAHPLVRQLTPEEIERRQKQWGTPGGMTCDCGEFVWRYRTSGNPNLRSFDEYPGGPYDHPPDEGTPEERAAVSRPGRGNGELKLHRCDGEEVYEHEQ